MSGWPYFIKMSQNTLLNQRVRQTSEYKKENHQSNSYCFQVHIHVHGI